MPRLPTRKEVRSCVRLLERMEADREAYDDARDRGHPPFRGRRAKKKPA